MTNVILKGGGTKMDKSNSTEYITYKDYTSTSNISGVTNTSSKGDSLITIIKNAICIYDTPSPSEKDLAFKK